MAIDRLLEKSALPPEQIRAMVSAYEDCLRILKLADRSDPLTEMVAKSVIEVAQTGERDPVKICHLALKNIESASDR